MDVRDHVAYSVYIYTDILEGGGDRKARRRIDAHSLAWQLQIGEGGESGRGRRTRSGLRSSGARTRSGSDDDINTHSVAQSQEAVFNAGT